LTFIHLNDIFPKKSTDLFHAHKRFIQTEKFTLSFEVFPPTREGNLENLFVTIKELSDLKPDFISVTYGAGAAHGEDPGNRLRVKKDFNTEALAHLTCVQSTRDDIARILDLFKDENIENILALRGDPPAGAEKFIRTKGGFGYANELVSFIRGRAFFHWRRRLSGRHIEAPSLDADMLNLKRKWMPERTSLPRSFLQQRGLLSVPRPCLDDGHQDSHSPRRLPHPELQTGATHCLSVRGNDSQRPGGKDRQIEGQA